MSATLRAAVAAATCMVATAVWVLGKRRRTSTPTPHVLVVMAVHEEARFLEHLLAEHSSLKVMPLAHLRRVRGRIGALSVDVVTCGIGEVDAATATTIAMLEEPTRLPIAVLSVGCSGAHRADICAGDVMLGSAIVPTACKMVRADGMHEHVGHRLTTSEPPLVEFVTDLHLLGLARAAALSLASTTMPAWPISPLLAVKAS